MSYEMKRKIVFNLGMLFVLAVIWFSGLNHLVRDINSFFNKADAIMETGDYNKRLDIYSSDNYTKASNGYKNLSSLYEYTNSQSVK